MGVEILLVALHATETEISSGLVGHFGSYADFTFTPCASSFRNMQILIYEGFTIYGNICFCQGSNNIITCKTTQGTFPLNFVTSLKFTQQLLRKEVTGLT